MPCWPQIPRVLIAFMLDVIGSHERTVEWIMEAYRERYATPLDVVDLLRKYRADPRAAAVLRDLGLGAEPAPQTSG